MSGILAIETSADACSIVLARESEEPVELYEFAPRRHNRIIFEMLGELVPGGDLVAQGIDCLAFGAGPGSFTGLRIAASAVQGLAYSNNLPVVAVPTLAIQAQGAFRLGLADEAATVLSVIDARVGEIYCGVYSFSGGVACERRAPWATTPASLSLAEGQYIAVGDGLRFSADFPLACSERISSSHENIAPRALDMLPVVNSMRSRGEEQAAADVQPLYVREKISWKKLAEQGKRA